MIVAGSFLVRYAALMKSALPPLLRIVAIDGPAGAGKTTAARRLAQRLGFLLVDTGALYRCLALEATTQGVSYYDTEGLSALATRLFVEFVSVESSQQVRLHGVDVTERIREPDISRGASQVSLHREVRAVLLPVQREWAHKQACVVEGRDIGTVVLPEAPLKFFITARPEIRAQRRFQELTSRGVFTSVEEVLGEQLERDRRDTERQVAPTLPASDAILLDTSELALDTVVDWMEQKARVLFLM